MNTVFHILGVLMMFNMLVAFFTQAAEEVLENADKQWKFTRTEVIAFDFFSD